ncbi:MAG: sugar kinase [Bacteroidetes bacterium]|nr:sugar kinase [Bacteroidota bacterium]
MNLSDKNKICCFGELLLRFSPEAHGNWITQHTMPVFIGGAELNVAHALAAWQVPVKYITALPSHSLSNEIVSHLSNKQIDTSSIHFSGDRIGTYYLPQGADLKNAGVIYDRAGSSFSCLQPGMIDWDNVLSDCNWFHFTAISPALNESAVAVLKEVLPIAKKKGLTISVDLNYRAKLWQYGKKPSDIMTELVQYCDIVMGNIWAAEQLLNIPSSIKDSIGQTTDTLVSAAQQSMLALHQQYPGVQTIAYTFRLDSSYFALLQHGPVLVQSLTLPLTEIADKAGSGDCFMGGLIYGFYQQAHDQDIIDFAAAAAVGKMKEKGDSTSQTTASVKQLIKKEWTATHQ